MMTDYEYVFAMALQSKLKPIIKGRIYVTVVPEDDLVVKIYYGDEEPCRLYIRNITDKILWGWSANDAVRVVIANYKQFLFERSIEKYFYND